MKSNLKKILILLLGATIALSAKTINLDKENISLSLKNNSMNVLNFPFIVQKANLSTENPESFNVSSRNKTVVIVPTTLSDKEKGDLLVWSATGNAYLIKIKTGSRNQTFNFVTNFGLVSGKGGRNLEAAKYETGQVERDIKKIIKKLANGEKIPGYRKQKVKKYFSTPDLKLQKEFYYDGGKYRAEQWYVKNKTRSTISLKYDTFRTNGVIGISFLKRTLKPGQVTKMWLIIDKNTISQRLNNRRIK